jgi:putative peptide zinc metalloprotease protein
MAQSLSPHTHLPALRDDLRFLGRTQGSGGETVWLIFDPLRNRYLELRPVVYEVLSRWQTGTIGALMADIRADTAYQLDIQDIGTLIAYLRQHQLLRRSSSPQPSATPGWAANAHKYLSAIVFFRLRLLRPDRWLEIAGDAISPIFSTWFWIAVALAGGAGMLLVARQWDSFLGTFVGFLDIQGVAVLMVAIVISKIVHELGHAFSAKHYGCRIHAMGLAFILGMPLAYTDVSDTWRLKDRRQRLRVSAGGILAETLLAVVATWGWLILPDGSARAACFVLATTGWLGTLLINLNPFMRFDGYYLLSDALGIKNLQQRSFTLGLWALRRTLWGWPEPAPEKVTRRFLTFMVSFAWLTWVVRAMIFFGIAVLAYVMFGKTFGTLIAAVEIAIFIAAPIFKEVFVWIEKRKIWLKQKRAKRTLGVFGVCFVVCRYPAKFSVGDACCFGACGQAGHARSATSSHREPSSIR